MIIFLLVVCLIELVWIVGSIAVMAYLFSDEDKEKVERLVSLIDDAPRDAVSALLVALWLPCVILSYWRRFTNWIRGKRD